MKLKDKTGKREIALGLTGVLVWSIFQGNTAMVEVIVWPILSYVAAASGLHIYHRRAREERVYGKT